MISGDARKINEFYVAYAYRKTAEPSDINACLPTYEAAEAEAYRQLCDDDDSKVFIKVDGKYYAVYDRSDNGRLIVAPEDTDFNWLKSVESNWI